MDSCDWKENLDGYWETQCGNAHTLAEGYPMENNMKFCCYCGKPLNEIRFQYEQAEN